ncbi:MAG: DUF362 domain-containing protein [Candidatus Lokiarchaeota archaeon]|nr:DUF362 domain-containing protein [Candidatus Lokiarchaeota archaeon]
MNSDDVILIKGNNASEMFKQAFNHIDIKSLVEGKQVVLKPNLACWDPRLPKKVNEWVVTKPAFIADFIRFLKTFKPKSISVAESSFIGENMDKKYKNMKLKEIINDPDIQIINLDKLPHKKMAFFDRKIEISEYILDAEVLINMPMLKTHPETAVSIGMKNLKGILSGDSKKIFHRYGLFKSIAQLSKILLDQGKPTLTLVEGLLGLEGMGPLPTGKPKEVGCIILGKNTVSVEAVAIAIMGFTPEEAQHVKYGEEYGAGIGDLSKINIIGNKIEEVKVDFEKPPNEETLFLEALKLLELPEDLIDGKHGYLCSTCLLNYLGPIWALRDDAGKEFKQKIYLLSGQAGLPESYEGQLILWGNCQRKNYNRNEDNAIFVKGCPPSLMTGYMTLGKTLYTRKKFLIGLIKRIFKGMSKIGRLEHWPQD